MKIMFFENDMNFSKNASILTIKKIIANILQFYLDDFIFALVVIFHKAY